MSLILSLALALTVHQAPTPPIQKDISQLQALEKFAERAEVVAREWYPKIEVLTGLDGPSDSDVHIVMDAGYDGVAATSGTRIQCSLKYYAKHLDDLGSIVHEMVHVVQRYPKYDPVWLVEGIADWVRWFNYEPVAKRPHPTADKAKARASYRTTATFLDWAQTKYDKELVKKLNRLLRDGAYTEETWKTLTGKTLDELEVEWIAAIKAG